ncbi:MAG: M15 family metallopeptidase [bacterium]|nr:M15 family metallopeptidase [bacterium]
MHKEIILISDPRVVSIPIQENHESFVDLKTIEDLFFDFSGEDYKEVNPNMSLVRKVVADMLVRAQISLPKGYRLMIKECFRDLATQTKIFLEYKNALRSKFKELSEEELYKKASVFISPPEIVPPHSTGGAVDLTLMTENGEELDMGTKFNADPAESNFATYTYTDVSEEIKSHRKILIDVMEKVGFVNYPTEWWHWSYGDRYWAYNKGEAFAIYNSK